MVTTAGAQGDDGPLAVSAIPVRRRSSVPALVLSYLVTVAVLLTLNFLLPRAMPGDPLLAQQASGSPTYVFDDDSRAALADYYDLDQPLLAQYREYLAGLVHGDLGRSITFQRPAADLVRERLPWTALLIGAALAVAALVGVLAGIHAGWRRGRPVDRASLAVFLTLYNAPSFFLASAALLVFSVRLGWFPLSGARTPFTEMGVLEQAGDILRHLTLPAAALAVQPAAWYYLVMRGGMVSELGADHLVLGRAKGLRDRRLEYGYAARNAFVPVVTISALQLRLAVAGTVFVETVFAYPGLGRLLFDAVRTRDYPVLQGCFLVLTLLTVTANLAADVLTRRLDPRTAA
ncbi:MAG: ABC transporter permease [Acidimicrobiia bacterium]|nr:ABC transporter permease [Acidimicrobiia bacterium]